MEKMNIKRVLASGPVSLAALEAQFGLGVSEDIQKMAAAGEVVRTVSGNYLHSGFLRRGERVLLPHGVVARVESVEGPFVRAVPESYPFANTAASFAPVKWKMAAVKMVLAEETDVAKAGNYVITLPGYPSMQMKGDSGLQALTNAVAKLMEASSNKKIVFHDEWFGEPQFGNLVNKLRPNLDRYVTPAPEAGHEGVEPRKLEPSGTPAASGSEQPAPPAADAPVPTEQESPGILENVQKEDFKNSVTEEAADKIVQRLTSASFVDWAARHYAISDICRVLNVTLKEAAKSIGKDFIRESDKKGLIQEYLLTLSDKLADDYETDCRIQEKDDVRNLSDEELGRFIVRQDQLRGIRPQGSTADKMANLWALCAQSDREATENYGWRVLRGNVQRRAGLQSVETPLIFTIWMRDHDQRPQALKVAYEEAMKPNRVLGPDDVDIEKAANALVHVFGFAAEEVCALNPKLSELVRGAILGYLRQL